MTVGPSYPTVSVVIAAHRLDRWPLLLRAIESIEHQHHRPLEIIVVIDGHEQLAARARTLGERVQVIALPCNLGLSTARNTGIDAATGELVAFLDDDAAAAPDWLELLVATLEPRILGASGSVQPDWQRNPPSWLAPELWWTVGCTYRGLPTTRSTVRNFFGGCAVVRRNTFERVGGFRPELGRRVRGAAGGEEAELCVRATNAIAGTAFVYEPAATVRHYVPVERLTLRYLFRRSFAEGRSKATVRWLTGSGAALSVERNYVRDAILGAWANDLKAALRLQVFAAVRLVVSMLAFAAAGAGYCVGRAATFGRRPPHFGGSPTRPVKVAMIAARAYPFMGGIETHIEEVAPRLAHAGFQVELLTTDPRDGTPTSEERDGVRVARFRSYPHTRDWYFAPGLYRAAARGAFDVVHIEGIHTFSAILGMLAARRAKVPCIVQLHTGGHSSKWRHKLRSLQWRALRPLVRHADSIVAVSEFEADTLARGFGVDRSSIQVVRNGVSTLPIAAASDDDTIAGAPLLLSIGRLERYKGHHRAIGAMAAITRRFPDATLVIVGNGPYRDELRRLAREVAPRNTHFRSYGSGNRAELGRLIARADAVVLLSDYEAHPVSVIEALSLGVPVLGARTSGLSELIDDDLISGVDVDASPDEIADAVASTLARARPTPDLPTWDACAERIADVYRSVAGA